MSSILDRKLPSADGFWIRCCSPTPATINKRTYTGLLIAFIDVLPQRALVDKSVLPIASGGTLAHHGVIAHALRRILAALGAISTCPPAFI